MKRNKIFKIITLTLALSSVGTVTAFADGGYWQQSGSSWYYKDSSTGTIKTGWIQDNGYWYYLNSDGVMQTGWLYDSGNWYYLYSNGTMATNTTIGGYYLSSTGAWTTSTSSSVSSNSGSALTWEDVYSNRNPRGDIGQRQEDINAGSQLTNYNIDMSSDEQRWFSTLSMNLVDQRLTIDEAKANCVGKIVNGKYRISDIKFFDQIFSTTTGSFTDNKVNAIKNSSLSSYKSTSTYFYDGYDVFSCGNSKVGQWEASRTIVELEAV
ncbi:hypothetical protein [uncultured Clostridium sp.]|uniref:hypothetical protein n=1 Tax=uncultured Clostridium sp. TaxID=59620 RepID=UPI0028EA29CC|nr:hypothetical protein [uncultured Clostridium sp.]